MGRGIGSHTRTNEGETNTWLTPLTLITELGPFDLDPCAAPSPRPWPTAVTHIELPEDGLAAQWQGRVWCNPPYGPHLTKWLAKMAQHGSGIALTFARTETAAWQRWVWPHAKAVLFVAGRLFFHHPDGKRAQGNSGGPSALIAYSNADAACLQFSGIAGAWVPAAVMV